MTKHYYLNGQLIGISDEPIKIIDKEEKLTPVFRQSHYCKSLTQLMDENFITTDFKFYNNHKRYVFHKGNDVSITTWEDDKDFKNCWHFCIYLLDHTTLRLSLSDFGDKWDSGMFGILEVKKLYKDAGDFTKKDLKQQLQKIIDMFNCQEEGGVIDVCLKNDLGEIKSDIQTHYTCSFSDADTMLKYIRQQYIEDEGLDVDLDEYKKAFESISSS